MFTTKREKVNFEFFISCLIIITAVMIFSVGCQSGSKTEEIQEPQKDTLSLPTGWIEQGTVSLYPLGIKFELPITVYGDDPNGQWLANTRGGSFKIAFALFDEPGKKRDPKMYVRSRTKKLLGEDREPDALTDDELTRRKADEGYRSILEVDNVMPGTDKVVSSRTYVIEAIKYKDGSVLMISSDADLSEFPENNDLFTHFLNSVEGIDRVKPVNDAPEE
ncbi:MAG: hypothetical protein P9L92_07420 [Candidatus Electryonea clarkiae]|nr:hypothetical protein [Candidatus Electryonea clarkiae]MDP8285662.1 hypothetical protein [Candidatus Electryonea clarkiae]